MGNDKIRMPSSQGGLVNYSDTTGTKFKFKPAYVIFLVMVVLIIVLFLHWQGASWLGLQ